MRAGWRRREEEGRRPEAEVLWAQPGGGMKLSGVRGAMMDDVVDVRRGRYAWHVAPGAMLMF